MLSTLHLSTKAMTIIIIGLAITTARPLPALPHDRLPQVQAIELTNSTQNRTSPFQNILEKPKNEARQTPNTTTFHENYARGSIIQNCKTLCISRDLTPTFDQGATNMSDTRSISDCMIDLQKNLDPDAVGISKKEKKSRQDQHWKREGWVCGDRVFQLGKKKGKISAGETVHFCAAFFDKAANEGRDWFNCQVKSPHGMTTHSWLGWSPLGCRMGEEHKPQCRKEFVEKSYPSCFEEPCGA